MELRTGYKRTEVGVIPEDWEVVALANLSAFITKGATPTTFGFKWQADGVPFLRSECVSEEGLNLAQSMYISQRAHEVLQRSEALDGDLLVTITGNVGRVVRLANLGVASINQHIARVRITAPLAHRDFVYHYLGQVDVRRYYGSITTGQAYPQISLQQVRATPVPVPPLPEQRAIAEALGDVDALIRSLDQLIAKKRDIKQAAMQQLLTSRLRLPGFVGKWPRKRLGGLFKFLATAHNPRSDLAEAGEVGYLHYGDIHTTASAFRDCGRDPLPRIPASKVGGAALLMNGDLVLADASEDEAGIGKCVEIQGLKGERAVAGLHTFLLRGDPTLLADGFKAYLQFIPSVRTAMNRLATGISVFGISKNNVRGIEVDLPPLEEQHAIAEVLSDLDAELTALEARRDKTQALKQGMMQSLLTGRIRLV